MAIAITAERPKPVFMNKIETKEVACKIDENLKLHDFRIVKGPTRTNVIFDVVLPHDHEIKESQLKDLIQAKADTYNKGFCTVITVDREF